MMSEFELRILTKRALILNEKVFPSAHLLFKLITYTPIALKARFLSLEWIAF